MFADRYLVTSPAAEALGPAGCAQRRAIHARSQAPVERWACHQAQDLAGAARVSRRRRATLALMGPQVAHVA